MSYRQKRLSPQQLIDVEPHRETNPAASDMSPCNRLFKSVSFGDCVVVEVNGSVEDRCNSPRSCVAQIESESDGVAG